MTDTPFRNSARLVPARLLRNLWSIALLLVAVRGWGSRLPQPWSTVITVVAAVIIVVYVVEPFAAVFFKRLTVTTSHLTLRTGAITPVERTSALTKVSSVQVDEPWNLRLFGLCAVTIVSEGVESSAYVMDGLSAADAQLLVAHLDAVTPPPSRSTGTATGGDPAPAERDERPHADASPGSSSHGGSPHDRHEGVENSAAAAPGPGETAPPRFSSSPTPWELVATLMSQGTLLVAAAVVIGLADDAANLVGVDLVQDTSRNPVILALAVVALLVLTGVVAVAGFHGFRMQTQDDGRFRITYGAVGRVSHTVAPDQVVAITLVTTPLDALMGTCRVVVSTARLQNSTLGTVRFPSLRRAEAARVVRELTGSSLPVAAASAPRLWGLVPLAAVVCSVAIVGLLPHPRLWVTAIEGLVVLALVSVLLGYATGRVDVADDGSTFAWSRIGLGRTVAIYTADCARVLVLRTTPGLPLGHLCLVTYAHRRAALRKPVRGRTAYQALQNLQHHVGRAGAATLAMEGSP